MLVFPPAARVTRGVELQRIAREGKRIRTTYLEVRAAASPRARSEIPVKHMRIGVIVPRYKQSAVARNQLKRRVKELARLVMLPLAVDRDVVIRARPEAYNASFAHLKADVDRVATELAQLGTVPVGMTGSLCDKGPIRTDTQ